MDLSAGHSGAAASGTLEARVARSRIDMIYRQLPVSISGTLIGSALLVVVLTGRVDLRLMLAWFALMLANQGWRLSLYLRFRRNGVPEGRSRDWGRTWAIGAGISGLLWGAAGVAFFVPASPAHQTMVLVLIFAVIGTGVALLAPHPPSFYAFLLPTVIPLAARNAWEGDAPHLAVAFIVTVMALSIIGVQRRNMAMIVESLRNRYRNLDLVERLRERNRELDQARGAAEQANQAKNRFFAAASHDLRQPLHALGLFAGALTEKTQEPAALQLVHSINASVEALESLFDALMDMSRLEAGAIRPNAVHFPLQRVFNKLALDFEPEAAEQGLRLVVRPTAAHAFSDPLLLERILRNLLTNALRYTRHGGVLVGARPLGDGLSIEVWDTGPGISEDQRSRVFEEFVQLGSPAREGGKKGMGLGLAIVARLCRLLGHGVTLASRPGRGSVFRVAVPRGREQPLAQGPPQAAAPAQHSLEGVRVLVIDDDPAVLAGMRVLLEGWGARVFAGQDEAQALREIAASSLAPDLLITDLHLADGVSGFDVTRRLRERFGERTPGILVTGSVSAEHSDAARAQGLHFLLKPVTPAKLRTLIHFKLHPDPTAAAR